MSNIRSVSATAFFCCSNALRASLICSASASESCASLLDRRFRAADKRVGSVAEKRRRAAARQQFVHFLKGGNAHQRVTADDIVVQE